MPMLSSCLALNFPRTAKANYLPNVVMADIIGRGVCVPSGRVKTGETVDEAAIRETYEETGASLDPKRRQLIGCYRMKKRSGIAEDGRSQTIYSASFVAEVANFDPIPDGSESAGYFLLAPEDIADHYYMWDDLLAAVFEYAETERRRLFPFGERIDVE
jgi:8-oxo-dGTP diphosphatase